MQMACRFLFAPIAPTLFILMMLMMMMMVDDNWVMGMGHADMVP